MLRLNHHSWVNLLESESFLQSRCDCLSRYSDKYIRMKTYSYITKTPHIESASLALFPTPLTLPDPRVPYQFMALLGPAWNTKPFFHPKSHAWLSARKLPRPVAMSMGATGAPGSLMAVLFMGLYTSPSFLPVPRKSPPMEKTRPSEVSALD